MKLSDTVLKEVKEFRDRLPEELKDELVELLASVATDVQIQSMGDAVTVLRMQWDATFATMMRKVK